MHNAKQPRVLLSACAFLAFAIFLVAVLLPNSKENKIPKETSIAVLPLSLMANNSDISFFADGLAEELIHQLTMLPNYRVISKTSSFMYRDTVVPTTEIGEKLNMNYLIQGSVRQEDELLKVNIQLVDAAQDTALWSQSFAATVENAFSIQQQISRQVATTLGGENADLHRGRYTPASGEAYLHLLRGRKYNQVRTPDSLLKGRDEFLMATMLEPNYADAYVDLAVSYLLMAQNKMLTLEEANREAGQAIETALRTDPQLPEAYAAKGILAYNNNQLEEAKLAFEQALALNGNLYLALINYGNLLRNNFQSSDALPYYERSLEIAPLSAPAHWGLGNLLLSSGNYDEAVTRYQTCVYRLPNDSNCVFGLAYAMRLTTQPVLAQQTFDSLDEAAYAKEYYYRLAKAWHYLWKDQPILAEQIYEAMLAEFGFTIEGLQSITLVKHRLDKQTDWFEQIAEAYAVTPDNLEIHVNYVTAAYLHERCDKVITEFSTLLGINPQMFEDANIIGNAVPYYAMLADCHRRENNHTDMQETISQFARVIENLSDNQSFVPGFAYARANYYALIGDTVHTNMELNKLRAHQWPLYWLVDKNPLFASSR